VVVEEVVLVEGERRLDLERLGRGEIFLRYRVEVGKGRELRKVGERRNLFETPLVHIPPRLGGRCPRARQETPVQSPAVLGITGFQRRQSIKPA
jgi:hypothetical protein